MLPSVLINCRPLDSGPCGSDSPVWFPFHPRAATPPCGSLTGPRPPRVALSPLPQLRPQLAPCGAEPEQTGALDVSSGLNFQGWRPQAFNPGPGSLLGKGDENLVKLHVERAGLWDPHLCPPQSTALGTGLCSQPSFVMPSCGTWSNFVTSLCFLEPP